MTKVHSHYENLKVARDASADEIRTAYRALSRRHHPDRNPDNADSQRVMSVINVAYDVLSQPARRSEHDRWIAQQEAEPSRPGKAVPTLHAPSQRYRQQAGAAAQGDARNARQVWPERRLRRTLAHLLRHRLLYVFGGIAASCVLAVGVAALEAAAPGAAVAKVAGVMKGMNGVNGARVPGAVEVPMVAGYTRSPTAPNGAPWPVRSGYVAGYPQMSQGGLSEVRVDNSRSPSDMFVKLVSLDGITAFPARTFFVAARGQMTLDGLVPGTYELRYRNLASGGLWRTPVLILEDVATERGPQHSTVTVSLYPVPDGSLKSFALLDTEF